MVMGFAKHKKMERSGNFWRCYDIKEAWTM
jgi:hypothetical protein